MKKTFILFLIGVSVAFCSCNNKPEENNKNQTGQNNQQKQAPSVPENNVEQPNEAEKTAMPQKQSTTNLQTGIEDNLYYSNEGKVLHLTKDEFIEKIWDYENNPQQWIFNGELPVIIDFYADWCGPCKRVAPIMDELAQEYEGKINIFKIDTEKERELAGVFRVQSIPSMLFVPARGKPTMTTGAFPKEEYVKIINDVVLN